MIRIFNYKLTIFILVLGELWVSCHKMDDTYREFLKDGEFRYGKIPDSAWISPGDKRAKVSLILSGTNYAKYAVYWNDGADSLIVPISLKKQLDTVSSIIDPIAEGTYTFEYYTYDLGGHRSVKSDTIGTVYGDEYRATLFNRVYKAFKLDDLGKPMIIWDPGNVRGGVGIELMFKDVAAIEQHIKRAITEDTTRINYELLDGSLQYRTLFKPDSNAIDTFYTNYQSLHL
ncbi:protein of unknown function [bacterium A37T11]|nr:protein of unknown function [bacterium A37T11]